MNSENLLSERLNCDSYIPFWLTRRQRMARQEFTHSFSPHDHQLYTRCPLCSGNNFKLIARKDRRGLPVDNYLCKTCGVVFKNPVLNKKSTKIHYEKFSARLRSKELNPNEIEKLFYKRVATFAHNRFNFIHKNISDLKESDLIAEIGCYDGANLLPWKEAGYETIGVDLDDSSFHTGNSENLNLIKSDLGYLADSKPKLIILSHVLEHMIDPKKDMIQIRDILGDHGYLYIEVPGVRVWSASDILRYLDVEHNFSFDLTSLTNLLSHCSFTRIVGDEYIRSVFKPTNVQMRECEKNDLEDFLQLTEDEFNRSIRGKYYRCRLYLMNKILFPLDDVLRGIIK